MDEKQIARFWSKVEKGDGCWLWTAQRNASGYGKFRTNVPRMMQLAHRFAFSIEHGDPRGFCVCHRCDNPGCVRPDHLFLGTKADNTRDMISKGRRVATSAKGEANCHAVLVTAHVLSVRSRLALGERRSALAREFGVSKSTIDMIAIRATWRHV